MGNCLEPTQSEIDKIRRYKLKKSMTTNGEIRQSRRSSSYSHLRPARSFIVTDPQTGHHFLVQNSALPTAQPSSLPPGYPMNGGVHPYAHSLPNNNNKRPPLLYVFDPSLHGPSRRSSNIGVGDKTGSEESEDDDEDDDNEDDEEQEVEVILVEESHGHKEEEEEVKEPSVEEVKKEKVQRDRSFGLIYVDKPYRLSGRNVPPKSVDQPAELIYIDRTPPKTKPEKIHLDQIVVTGPIQENGRAIPHRRSSDVIYYTTTGRVQMTKEDDDFEIIDYLDPGPTTATSDDDIVIVDYIESDTPTGVGEIFSDRQRTATPPPSSYPLVHPVPTVTDTLVQSQQQPTSSKNDQKTVSFLNPPPDDVSADKLGSSMTYDEIDSSHRFSDLNIFQSPDTEVDTKEDENTQAERLREYLNQEPRQSLPAEAVDVVITYSMLGEYELGMVWRLTRQLESSGLSVWAERLGDSSKARKSEKTSEAILGAKILIVMLSEGSCVQRFIRDHVALATMTGMVIFPVASEPPKDILDAMPRELKVQLSSYTWTELTRGGSDDRNMFRIRSLARSVQDVMDDVTADKLKGMITLRGNLRQRKDSNPGINMKAPVFWDVHFGHRNSVKWPRLLQTVQEGYRSPINNVLPPSLKLLLNHGLRNRLVRSGGLSDDVKQDGVVDRADFVKFGQSNSEDSDVWDAITRVSGLIQAVKDVFNKDSTVRSLVLEYTEYFNNQSVKKTLGDLLYDKDPELRAVAVVSLARMVSSSDDDDDGSDTPLSSADSNSPLESLERALGDDDPLVRLAGCLALGHLKVNTSVNNLERLWKNDDDLKVKEAARSSLDRIRGQEVKDE